MTCLFLPPTLCGLIAILMWSSMFLILALSAPIPPFLLGFVSFGIGFLTITAGSFVTGASLLMSCRRPWRDYFYTIGGVGGYTVIIYVAFKSAPAFEVSIINYLWPILLALMSSAYHRIPLSKFQLSGLVLGFCGTVIPLLATAFLALGGFGPDSISVALAAFLIITGCLLVNHQRLQKLMERFL